MSNSHSPPTEFNENTLRLLAQAGTVGLPYPPPASGRVYMGINLDYREDLPWASPRYYLRVVQTQSPRQVITRIVDLQELRGVSLPTVELQLLFIESAADIPRTGSNLVIVAQVDDVLYFRIFNSHGKCDVDKNSASQDLHNYPIDELKELLQSLRAPHVLTSTDTNHVLLLVTAIVDHTYLPSRENGALRVFLTTNQIARDLLSTSDRLSAVKRDAGMTERLLYSDAVIYVSEQAPVYVQIKSEFGVTAAEAAENVEQESGRGTCTCPTYPWPLS